MLNLQYLNLKRRIFQFILVYIYYIFDNVRLMMLFANYRLLPKVRVISTKNHDNITMNYYMNHYFRSFQETKYSGEHMVRYHHEGNHYAFIVNHVNNDNPDSMLFHTIDSKINDISASLATENTDNVHCRRYLKFYQNGEEIIVNQELLDEFYHYVKNHQYLDLKTILHFVYPGIIIDSVKFIVVNPPIVDEIEKNIDNVQYMDLYT